MSPLLTLTAASDLNSLVNFPEFDFRLAATKRIRPEPTTTITWEDNLPKSGFSKDNVQLIYYLPHFTPENTLVSGCDLSVHDPLLNSSVQQHLNEGLLDMAKIDPPHRGKTKTSQEKVGIFVDREGEIAGEKRIVKGWQGIAHNVRLPSSPCCYHLKLTENII